MLNMQWRSHRGLRGALDSENFAKNRGKEGGNQERAGIRGKKSRKRGKSERFFHTPLLTDSAGYATDNMDMVYNSGLYLQNISYRHRKRNVLKTQGTICVNEPKEDEIINF